MHNKIVLSLIVCGCIGLAACTEKQPVNYEYYHKTRGVSYQEGEETPFTKEEIAQAQKEAEAQARETIPRKKFKPRSSRY